MNTIAFIKAFFEDFPGPIASKAVEYAKIFENKGFDSKESLKGITSVDQLERWKIPEVYAIQIVAQIRMLFAPVVLPVFTPMGGGAPLTSVAPTHVGSQNARPADVTSDDAYKSSFGYGTDVYVPSYWYRPSGCSSGANNSAIRCWRDEPGNCA